MPGFRIKARVQEQRKLYWCRLKGTGFRPYINSTTRLRALAPEGI
jgi:hypothetical protein